jgi:hypothetical protein
MGAGVSGIVWWVDDNVPGGVKISNEEEHSRSCSRVSFFVSHPRFCIRITLGFGELTYTARRPMIVAQAVGAESHFVVRALGGEEGSLSAPF